MSDDDEFQNLAQILKEDFIPLLTQSLDACAARHLHTLNEGSDNFSFGTDAWSFPANRIKDFIKSSETDIQLSNKSGCVLIYGKYEFRHHRVGDSANDDIRECFPNGAKGLCNECEEQYAFEFIANDNPYDGHAVLAYTANANEGLCSAYLAIPSKIEKSKIVGWARIEELFHIDNDPVSGDKAPVPVPPAPETAPKFEIKLNANKLRKDILRKPSNEE